MYDTQLFADKSVFPQLLRKCQKDFSNIRVVWLKNTRGIEFPRKRLSLLLYGCVPHYVIMNI